MQYIPDWITKNVQDGRELFGVGGVEWHITVRLSDKPNGDKGCDGAVDVDAVYLNAEIELKDTLEDNEIARAEIYHEVLHIPHQEIDHWVHQIIRELPEEQGKIYRYSYDELVERFIQRISRSVCCNLKAGIDQEVNHAEA
jgi:hypothetical protein